MTKIFKKRLYINPIERLSELRRLQKSKLFESSLAKWLVIGVPYLWLLLFFLLPFFVVLYYSIATTADNINFSLVTIKDTTFNLVAEFGRYKNLFSDFYYLEVYLSSVGYATINTLLCLIIGYPFAYFMARAKTQWQPALLVLVLLPFWTSFLLRVYAWRIILDDSGIINVIITSLGFEPIIMLYTPFSLIIGMVYTYLPFMILPLYAYFTKLDISLLEAASDLGAKPIITFLTVTLPMSINAIFAGSLLVFIPSVGEYVIPELIGGPEILMIGRVLWDELFSNNDWGMASAVAIVMILLIVIPLVCYNRYQLSELEKQNG